MHVLCLLDVQIIVHQTSWFVNGFEKMVTVSSNVHGEVNSNTFYLKHLQIVDAEGLNKKNI